MHHIALLATFILGALLTAAPVGAAQVTRFAPQGTVKQVRQASVTFSEPMVAFGDRAPADPFDVTCPVPGRGRWMDAAHWVYDFERDLPAGLRCVFRRRAGLKSLAGRALTGPADFAFATGGPAVRMSIPREGCEWIDEEQAFVLSFDAEPTAESLQRHVGFAVEGIPQRVGFRVLTGDEREAILNARLAEPPRGPVLVIQAVQRFPNRARVILVWGKGVAAESGVATDKDQSLSSRSAIPSPYSSTASARTRTPAAFLSRRSAFASRRRWPWTRRAGWCSAVPTAESGRPASAKLTLPGRTRSASRARFPKRRFEAADARGSVRFMLDGDDLGSARELYVWRPIRGRRELTLVDDEKRVVDRVSFEVRGVARAAP